MKGLAMEVLTAAQGVITSFASFFNPILSGSSLGAL